MAETAEQLSSTDVDINFLNARFYRLVEQIQEAVRNDNPVDASVPLLYDFDTDYRKVPKGYHLRIGLTESAWDRLNQPGSGDLKLFTHKEQAPTGSRYFVDVARYIESPNDMAPSTTVLQASFRGDLTDGYLGLIFCSKKMGIVESGYGIKPGEILWIKAVKDVQRSS